MYLQDTHSSLILRAGDQQIACTRAEFATIEPEYQPPPDGAARIWSEPVQCLLQDGDQIADPWYTPERLAYFCGRIAQYADALDALHHPQTIWVHTQQAKALLCASDPADAIPFDIAVRFGPAADDPPVPMTAMWPIMLRQKNGLAMDNILISFTDGQATGRYTYNPALPLGEWYIDESDFTTVDLDGVQYLVKLANTVRFTIYRTLANA